MTEFGIERDSDDFDITGFSFRRYQEDAFKVGWRNFKSAFCNILKKECIDRYSVIFKIPNDYIWGLLLSIGDDLTICNSDFKFHAAYIDDRRCVIEACFEGQSCVEDYLLVNAVEEVDDKNIVSFEKFDYLSSIVDYEINAAGEIRKVVASTDVSGNRTVSFIDVLVVENSELQQSLI
jgi:hypothetical protein